MQTVAAYTRAFFEIYLISISNQSLTVQKVIFNCRDVKFSNVLYVKPLSLFARNGEEHKPSRNCSQFIAKNIVATEFMSTARLNESSVNDSLT